MQTSISKSISFLYFSKLKQKTKLIEINFSFPGVTWLRKQRKLQQYIHLNTTHTHYIQFTVTVQYKFSFCLLKLNSTFHWDLLGWETGERKTRLQTEGILYNFKHFPSFLSLLKDSERRPGLVIKQSAWQHCRLCAAVQAVTNRRGIASHRSDKLVSCSHQITHDEKRTEMHKIPEWASKTGKSNRHLRQLDAKYM